MSMTIILWSLLFSSIGFGYFLYGKKQSRPVIRYTGIALIIFPYFIQNIIALIIVGCMLLLLPKFWKV
jgi:hypothetical protein